MNEADEEPAVCGLEARQTCAVHGRVFDACAVVAGEFARCGGLDNDNYVFEYVFEAAAVVESDVVIENAGQGIDTLDFSSLVTKELSQINSRMLPRLDITTGNVSEGLSDGVLQVLPSIPRWRVGL